MPFYQQGNIIIYGNIYCLTKTVIMKCLGRISLLKCVYYLLVRYFIPQKLSHSDCITKIVISFHPVTQLLK